MPKKNRLTESVIQASVVNYARENLFLARKYVNENRRAAPDYIFFKDSRTAFIEFKKTGESATPAQQREHKKLKAVGYPVLVCDDIEIGKAYLDTCILCDFDEKKLSLFVEQHNA